MRHLLAIPGACRYLVRWSDSIWKAEFMPHPAKRSPLEPVKVSAPWRLEEAKARFSEVVRRARTEGPQHVTVRGQDAVVVIAVEELARLLPPVPRQQPLVEFLQGLELGSLDVERERDLGRDLAL